MNAQMVGGKPQLHMHMRYIGHERFQLGIRHTKVNKSVLASDYCGD